MFVTISICKENEPHKPNSIMQKAYWSALPCVYTSISAGWIKPVTGINRRSENSESYLRYLLSKEVTVAFLCLRRQGVELWCCWCVIAVCGGSRGCISRCLASERVKGKWERGLMSVYFYFPLNFTHCWVSLLTDCLWWCWRSTNTAEEAVHITPPHCSISPCRTSTYLISPILIHPCVCNLPPTWECVCVRCTYQVVAVGIPARLRAHIFVWETRREWSYMHSEGS